MPNQEIIERIEKAASLWPPLRAEDICAHALRHVEGDEDATLAQCHVEEVALVMACAAGSTQAITRLRDVYLRPVTAQLRRFERSGVSVEEIESMLHTRLFSVEHDGTPVLLRYDGRGSLEGWIRVIGTRLTLNAVRARQSETERESEVVRNLLVQTDTPEDLIDKETLREHFREAFAKAVSSLSGEERDALRMHVYEGLGIDEIAEVFAVHRATAARWLSRARQQLAELTHRELGVSLGMRSTEASDVTRLMLSQLELSLSRLLG